MQYSAQQFNFMKSVIFKFRNSNKIFSYYRKLKCSILSLLSAMRFSIIIIFSSFNLTINYWTADPFWYGLHLIHKTTNEDTKWSTSKRKQYNKYTWSYFYRTHATLPFALILSIVQNYSSDWLSFVRWYIIQSEG